MTENNLTEPPKSMPGNNLNEIRQLLIDNQEAIAGLEKGMKKIKRYMLIRTIISVVWILLVILPTIAAVVYLPSLVSAYGGNFTDLIKMYQTTLK